MANSITVAVRIRPSPSQDAGSGSGIEDDLVKVVDNSVVVKTQKEARYHYDHVFPGTGPTQADVYDAVGEPIVQHAIHG